jgi:carbon storage regulator
VLVLSRRVKQSLVIGDGIVVTVVRVDGDRVRLGVIAPKDVRVDQAEVHERRKKELEDAA